MSKIASVPFTQNFAKTVAEQAISAFSNPLDLAKLHIFVPAPRQALALQNAFKNSAVLPNIMPLSGTLEMVNFLTHKGFLPPNPLRIVPALERQMVLTRLIRGRDKTLAFAAAWAMAESLAKTYDELTFYGITAPHLKQDIPPFFAKHWQQNYTFLEIVLEAYPAWLEEQNAQDESHFQQQILQAMAQYYGQEHVPVWAVGFSDTTPAGQAVLRAILDNENGLIAMQGLDIDAWAHAQNPLESSPQYPLFQLLNQLKTLPKTPVQNWGNQGEIKRDLTILEAPHALAEAQTIAAYLRQKLVDKNVTCAVITPDRQLAKLVQNELQTYDILVDDSAGIPYTETQAGQYILALVNAVATQLNPVAVATVLKHPSFPKIDKIEMFEQKILRGLAPEKGLAGLRKKLENTPTFLLPTEDKLACDEVLNTLANLVQPLTQLQAPFGVETYIQTLQNCCENMPQYLQDALENLAKNAHAIGGFGHAGMADLLQAYLQNLSYRPRLENARCFIWGPLEARMQQADITVLAGLNEGLWPRQEKADTWLHPALRRSLNLPPANQHIGLGAHDFSALSYGSKIVLTRALTADNRPALASRFLVRMPGNDVNLAYEKGHKILDKVQILQRIGQAELQPMPLPKPPVTLRPTVWSATALDTFMNNPYRTFTQYILGVKIWDPFNQMVTPAVLGTLVHRWLEQFGKSGIYTLENLKNLAENEMKDLPQATQNLLLPRMKTLAPAIIKEWENDAKTARVATYFEQKKTQDFAGFTFQAKMDREDESPAGPWVLDYKTTAGSVPSAKDVALGKRPQLALELWLLAQESAAVAGVDVWKIGVSSQAGFARKTYEISRLEKEIDAEIIPTIEAGLQRFSAHMQNAETVFFYHTDAPDYDGLQYLARTAEWEGR